MLSSGLTCRSSKSLLNISRNSENSIWPDLSQALFQLHCNAALMLAAVTNIICAGAHAAALKPMHLYAHPSISYWVMIFATLSDLMGCPSL